MCIIAAKPEGIKMPSKDTIRTMWLNNPDGAGYMYVKDGKVRIEKGFMKLSEFEKSLEETRKHTDLDKSAVVLHFRITTHGGTCPENTHPFPVTRNIKSLQSLETATNLGVAHNGIIPITPRKGISDTMEYIATQLAPLASAMPKFYRNKDAMELVKNAIKSKMAFLTTDNKIYLVGDFNEHEGIMYSNYTYEGSRWMWKGDNYFATDSKSKWSNFHFDFADEKDDSAPFDEVAPYVGEEFLMWGSELPLGSYSKYAGTMDELDFFLLDEENRVWEYDMDEDVCYPAPDVELFTPEGLPARFDPDKATIEVIGTDYYG